MRLAQRGRVHAACRATATRRSGCCARAVELGVNHIDTAAFYFSPLRSANELINSALAPYPDDLVITTKVGRAATRRASGWTGPSRTSCAGRSRRTCASSAATTSTW